MAERARSKKKPGAGKVKSRGRVATLPKKSKRGRGDNSGDHSVPDEVYERHLAKINSTEKAMDRAKAEYDQAKGVHQSAYKAAKSDGCDIDAIKRARKLDAQDHGIVQITYANVARVLNIMGSPLGSQQLDLFGSITAPAASPIDPYVRGEADGKAAVDPGGNPYTPGSEEFQRYAEGWAAGQQANMDAMAGSTVN